VGGNTRTHGECGVRGYDDDEQAVATMIEPYTQELALLRELLRGKGYRDALVLGPFGGTSGVREYTVPLYDEAGRTYLQTLRGTYADLSEKVRALPDRA